MHTYIEGGTAIDDWSNKASVTDLDRTYEAIIQERNNLSKATEISKRITQELVDGKNLQFIIEDVNMLLNIPILIEDTHFRDYAYAGLSKLEFEAIQADFAICMENQQIDQDFLLSSSVRKIQASEHSRLIIPIRVQNKIFGYCSFIYKFNHVSLPDLDYMVLERLSFIASLHLLNEKTSFEAMERMKGHFLEQVLNNHFLSKTEILKRGRFINLDLELPFFIMILNYQYKTDCLKNELVFHEELLETTLHYFKQKNTSVIIGQRAANNVLFIQPNNRHDDLTIFCKQFSKHLSTKYKGAIFQIGFSTLAEDIIKASDYYQEAFSALEMTTTTKNVVSFDDIGLVGMLLHSKDDSAIIQKAKAYLSPLTSNNSIKDTELLKTLYVFLQNGGNVERIMEELSISKTGLRYRIQKVESCLGANLRDPEVSYHLRLLLQVLLVKGELKID